MREVTAAEVAELQKNGKKIMVDFFAHWCGPCKVLIPRLEKMSEQYDNVEFVKVNVDENREYAQQLGIRGVPTVIIYDGTQEISRSVGANPDNQYTDVLDSL